jgi:hypothetical protein
MIGYGFMLNRLLFIMLLLTGCAEKGVVATIFLKEIDSNIYNLKGELCLESGFQINKEKEPDIYDLITYFNNCDIHLERRLKDFELKQWVPQKEQNASNPK